MFSKYTRSRGWIHSEWIADWTQPGISCQWTSQSVLDGQRQINYYQSRNGKKNFSFTREIHDNSCYRKPWKAAADGGLQVLLRELSPRKPYGVKISPSFKEAWRHVPWIKAIRTLKCSEWHCAVEEWVKEFCKLKDKSSMELGNICREVQTQKATIDVTEVQVPLLVVLWRGSSKKPESTI